MRDVLLISHRDLVESHTRSVAALFRGLAEHLALQFAAWEDGAGPSSIASYARLVGRELDDFDACILFVRYRLRREGEPLQWDGFKGLRLWLEEDGSLNFAIGRTNPWRGSFPPVFHRDRFDVMVTMGRQVVQGLREAGVNAYWLPKGYDQDAFCDLGEARSGVCTFGTPWGSRRALLDHLGRAGFEVTDVSGPYATLNRRLNRFAGALVCNLRSAVPLRRPGRLLNRWVPRFVQLAPGIEPMIKTFEVAGAGCAPVVDRLDELAELGFIDGETCLLYSDFAEAEERLRAATDDDLRRIGRSAQQLAARRHTWSCRAEQLGRLLEELIARRG